MSRFLPAGLPLVLLAALIAGCGHAQKMAEAPPAPPAAPVPLPGPALVERPMAPAMPVASPVPPARFQPAAPALDARLGRPAPPPAAPGLASPDSAKYPGFADNPWQRVSEQPVSTFSANVDTASYANLRRFLNRGQLPPRDAVRVEEMLNYFSYADPAPAAESREPFAVTVQLARSPWAADRGLLRIGLKARNPAELSLPPAHLVFLVDVSGSMGPQDRLPLVRAALSLLVSELRPQDRVSIVTYASGTALVLAPTPGDQKAQIRAAIDKLQAAGATYGAAGLRLAYEQARAGFIAGGINRVLLATDGDLNIGVTDPEQLRQMVDGARREGIALSLLGVGTNNFNDALMMKLASAGDGSYHYLDSLQEAHKVLVAQSRSTLGSVARDLKLQIEFNPAVADEYRLIGYELSALRREDFNNDRVDAGDIGAGHGVTALYEWALRVTRFSRPEPT